MSYTLSLSLKGLRMIEKCNTKVFSNENFNISKRLCLTEILKKRQFLQKAVGE